MKTPLAIIFLSLAALCLCYAKNAGWDNNVKPKISLVDAHEKALEALKSKYPDYYCLSASVARTFSECDWEMRFAAPGNRFVWVSVGTDRVRVSEQGFSY